LEFGDLLLIFFGSNELLLAELFDKCAIGRREDGIFGGGFELLFICLGAIWPKSGGRNGGRAIEGKNKLKFYAIIKSK
jgi:hypothetical protein